MIVIALLFAATPTYAIIPPGPNGIFGTENYGNKFSGEAALYRSFSRGAVRDVEQARTLAGFHFQNSCLEGANLGRRVARYVAEHYFQPVP